VDLNPHQVEAALFAFRSPLSKGAILADEVGLGKTIEAGILRAQKWAERSRHLLIIIPANLRQQWSQERSEKFFLPSIILENRTFNDEIRKGNLNPFKQPMVVICSYQFARAKEPYLLAVRLFQSPSRKFYEQNQLFGSVSSRAAGGGGWGGTPDGRRAGRPRRQPGPAGACRGGGG
jgi:SNF2 family DNA or RNA helicase